MYDIYTNAIRSSPAINDPQLPVITSDPNQLIHDISHLPEVEWSDDLSEALTALTRPPDISHTQRQRIV